MPQTVLQLHGEPRLFERVDTDAEKEHNAASLYSLHSPQVASDRQSVIAGRCESPSRNAVCGLCCGRRSTADHTSEKHIREWEPRNVLESELIDAICHAKTIRDYWMTLATETVAVECERIDN